MKKRLRAWLLTGLLCINQVQANGRKRDQPGPPVPLPVRLYDLAQVPRGTLQAATLETTRLFRSAGIALTWIQLEVEEATDLGIDMGSRMPGKSDTRAYFVVRLQRHTPAVNVPSALGFALPFARSGAHVSVFYDRVERSAALSDVPLFIVLGVTMAHELGHVFLQSPAHSEAGLMRSRWTRDAWRLASAGVVTFSSEEAQLMKRSMR